jgi:hypothetical protein
MLMIVMYMNLGRVVLAPTEQLLRSGRNWNAVQEAGRWRQSWLRERR